MASFLETHNLSLYTIPAGWVLAMAPHFYAMSLAGKTFDARNPRTFVTSLKDDQTLDNKTKSLIIRAEGAQQNSFENLGLYASAVVAGNIALLPISTLNTLSLAYLASRVVYNFVYVRNETEGTAALRTGFFLGGVGCIMAFFVKSGNVFVNRGGLL